MSQVQSITLKHHLSLTPHSYVSQNSIFPFKRNFSFTPNSTLSLKCYRPNPVKSKPFQSQQRRRRPPGRELPPKVFVDYSIYTKKGVLTVAPIAPEFALKSSGAFKILKEGYVLLQFAPSVGDDESIYDWNQKQVFSLTVTEMGTLISLGAKDSWEFLHENNREQSNEIEVRKVLKLDPLLDATGHMFSLSVEKRQENMEEILDSIFIPVKRAELEVLRSIFNYIIPCLLGWNAFANTLTPELYSQVNSTRPRHREDNEFNGDKLELFSQH